ncbi:MAG: TonB-dependent receptor [Pseudomonadota bacterium]
MQITEGIFRFVRAGAVGSLAFGAAASSLAQSDSSSSLEEVIVTATRRAESVQDIGVSVSALSGEQLRDANVVLTDDLSNTTPGLSLIRPGSPLAGLVAIRGVAQNDFASHLESANIFYTDDVYRPSNGGNLTRLYDVQRVEVLKGPQGTLFGRNATGGLIHVITNDPGDELDGYADLQISAFNTVIAEGAVNLPLTENARFRLAGYSSHNDGYVTNDIGADSGEMDAYGLRAKLHLDLSDKLSLRLTGEFADNESDAIGGTFPTGGFAGPDTLGQFRPSGNTDTGYIDADGDVFSGSFNQDGSFQREELNLAAEFTYDADSWQLKSISAFNDIDFDYFEDNDLSPFDVTEFYQTTAQQTFSQELRASVDLDGVRITSGLYYLNIDGDYVQGFQINNLGNFDEALGAPSEALPGGTPGAILIPLGQNQFADYAVETESWSVYAQAAFDVSEPLTLTAGLRFTHDEKDYRYQNFCESLVGSPLACPPADPETLAGAGVVTDNHDEDGISARLQLDYRATDNWLLYGSYNRGYKAFNYNAGFAGAAQVEFVRFDGEQLNAYELGSKLEFFGNRARLNVAGFYYDYNDYQAFDQRGVSFILSNTDATIYGFEGELTVSLDSGFAGRVGLTLLETDVKDIDIGGTPLDREAPQTPDVELNVGLSQGVRVAGGELRFGTDTTYVGDYFSQLTNAPVTAAGDYWNVNARVAFTPGSGKWDLAVFSRNLLNDEQLQYAFDITFPGNGLVEQVFANPRVTGVQLRVNF